MSVLVIVITSLQLQSVALPKHAIHVFGSKHGANARNFRPVELRQRQHLTPAAAVVSGRAASGVEVSAAQPARGIRRMFNDTRSGRTTMTVAPQKQCQLFVATGTVEEDIAAMIAGTECSLNLLPTTAITIIIIITMTITRAL